MVYKYFISYSFLMTSAGFVLAIFRIRKIIVRVVMTATIIKIEIQNSRPSLKNTIYMLFHNCSMA